MNNDTITEDGEIITGPPALVDTATITALASAEIDRQIATARSFPRDIRRVKDKVTTLATLDEETAQECLYALVRSSRDGDNKPIEGPSIRLAEIAAQCFGNCRVDARVVAINRVEKYVEAEGVFHDLETNMATRSTVRRRISTKKGYLFSDDMIVVTGNAACAIARRNAILQGIPRGLYRPAYQAARDVVAGKVEALSKNRERAVQAFASYGVKPEQIFERLGVQSEMEITRDHIATMRAMFATIKNGEATVEEMFGKPEPAHATVANPLDDDAPARKPDAPKQTTESSPDALAGSPGDEAGEAGSTSPATTDAPSTRIRGHTAEQQRNPNHDPDPAPVAGDAADRSGEGERPLSPEEIRDACEASEAFAHGHKLGSQGRLLPNRDPEWADEEWDLMQRGHAAGRAVRAAAAKKEG